MHEKRDHIERERTMNASSPYSLMAAFATLKSLSAEKRYQSPYQLLAEFIRHIVTEKAMYSFQSVEMRNLLSDTFGFVIPEAVIKTAARSMAGIELSGGIYYVSYAELGSDSLFEEKKKEADESNAEMIALLVKYIQERTGDQAVWIDVLTQELISFLVGEPSESGKYADIIGEFILKNEHNKDVQDFLNKVKEGGVLYVGLNHNIGETGSITKSLTLYLTTEILFSLAGYNGTIHKQFADDFYSQVRIANSGGSKKIALRYFSDIKKEIDDFFLTATEIVDGKKPQYNEKPAMTAIINGCETSSDVSVKQADFYHKLQYGYGITEDSNINYYDEVYFESNLESFDYYDDDDKKKKKETGIKYISHINKLRNGQTFGNDIDSEYLLITNTKATLLISKEQSDRIKQECGMDYISNFAVSLDRITSLLWYKLGNGFGNKAYPSTINAVLQARVILSASIAKNAGKAYFDTKKQYESGIITKEQLAGRIITLKSKPKLPEELQGDDIAEIMDFSPEFLSRYEEEHHSNQKALEETERILNDFRKEASAQISAKDATIASQETEITEKNKSLSAKDATIEAQKNRIEAQNAELEEYHKKEAKEKEKKETRKNAWLFIRSISWKLLVVAVVIFGSILLCRKENENWINIVGFILSAVSFMISVYSVIFKDVKKYFPKKSNRT